LDTTPRKMFEDDFLLALRTWRSQGERLLIFGDANEHILDGKYLHKAAPGGPCSWVGGGN
jgi:hypothetical protein